MARLFPIGWSEAVSRAKNGYPKELVSLLSGKEPIPPDLEREIRDLIAGFIDGTIKRKRGREPALCNSQKSLNRTFRNLPMAEAEFYVWRMKKIWKRRHGSVYGIEQEMIARAARRFGVGEDELSNRLHRPRNQRA